MIELQIWFEKRKREYFHSINKCSGEAAVAVKKKNTLNECRYFTSSFMLSVFDFLFLLFYTCSMEIDLPFVHFTFDSFS